MDLWTWLMNHKGLFGGVLVAVGGVVPAPYSGILTAIGSGLLGHSAGTSAAKTHFAKPAYLR